jgi:hypothetical protein
MAEPPSAGDSRAPAPTASGLPSAETEAPPSLKDLLLSDEARTDDLVPPRRRFKLRPLPALD